MPPTLNEIGQWISDVVRSKREEPHMDFKIEAKPDKLLKHITAMYNTPESPFSRCGYIVIGVSNQHDVLGLKPEERNTYPTADKRENALVQSLAEHTIPIPRIRVLEINLDEFPDAQLHVIEVATTDGPWSYIHTDRQDRGYFVRRGSQSQPPKPPEIDAYLQRLIFSQIEGMRREFTVLQATASEQRRQLDHLVMHQSPEQATNAQLLRTAFSTPERTLLRTVRSEVTQYLGRQGQLDLSHFPYFGLDRMHDDEQFTSEQRQALRGAVETLEEITRPLVELLGVLGHDFPLPTEDSPLRHALDQVLTELGDAVLFTGPGPDDAKLGSPTLPALRAYPALLLLFGAATVSVGTPMEPRWPLLNHLFGHVRSTHGLNGRRVDVYLASHWAFLPRLDYLMLLTDRTHRRGSASERLRDVVQRPEWLGSVLPPTQGRQVTRQAEIVTSLTYTFKGLAAGGTPPFVPCAWMMYPTARSQFQQVVKALDERALLSITGGRSQTWRAGLDFFGKQWKAAGLPFHFDPLEAIDNISS